MHGLSKHRLTLQLMWEGALKGRGAKHPAGGKRSYIMGNGPYQEACPVGGNALQLPFEKLSQDMTSQGPALCLPFPI